MSGAESVRIELAGLPVGKGRPRFVRATGHAFTPAKTRNYESDLRYAAQEAMAGRPPIAEAVSVSVLACFPIPQSWSKKKQLSALNGGIHPTNRPDCDNLLKVLDALNQIVFVDDKQIVSASIRKEYSDRPRLEMTVSPLTLPFMVGAAA